MVRRFSLPIRHTMLHSAVRRTKAAHRIFAFVLPVWVERLILDVVIGSGFASVLASARQGDEAAFSQLWRELNPALVRYLALFAGGAAEDIAADTWLTVIRGLRHFDGDENGFRAWVFTTARRRTFDESRRRKRRESLSLSLSGAGAVC